VRPFVSEIFGKQAHVEETFTGILRVNEERQVSLYDSSEDRGDFLVLQVKSRAGDTSTVVTPPAKAALGQQALPSLRGVLRELTRALHLRRHLKCVRRITAR
jgi:hypothetical protein